MNTYKITFEDIFSFAKSTRIAQLTEKQYDSALETIKNNCIVVDKLVNHCHIQLIIIGIEKI
jgi:hypothetical protein